MTPSLSEQLVPRVRSGSTLFQLDAPDEKSAVEEIRRAGWRMTKSPRQVLDIEVVKAIVGRSGGVDIFDASKQAAEPFLVDDQTPNGYAFDVEAAIRARDRFLVDDQIDYADAVETLLDGVGCPVVVYDTSVGFTPCAEGKNPCVEDVYGAVTALADPDPDRFPKRCLFVLTDVHEYLGAEDPRYRRALKKMVVEGVLAGGDHRRAVVLLQDAWTPPASLRHYCSVLEWEQPDEEALGREVDTAVTAPGFKGVVEPPTPQTRHAIVRALRGMTATEAANTLFLCGVLHGGFPDGVVKTIHRQKALAFKNDEVLEYVDADTIADTDDIGGYDNYFDFVRECIACYTPDAYRLGLRRPKGVLLLGIPGTGKSVVAMATAKMMGLPLIKYDFGSIFGSLVGESEQRQRKALARVKAQGPCVLLIDEADKAFGGMVGAQGDGGVGQRVFGRLLSWMANENTDAFVVKTMNRLTGPIEAIRAGRLDATFYTDFPTPSERALILAIHLRKNGADWAAFKPTEKDHLVTATDRYVGAELEQLCIKAVRTAFTARKSVQPTVAEMDSARKMVTPVAVLDEENIRNITDFCRKRAIPVNRPQAVSSRPKRRGGNFNPEEN